MAQEKQETTRLVRKNYTTSAAMVSPVTWLKSKQYMQHQILFLLNLSLLVPVNFGNVLHTFIVHMLYCFWNFFLPLGWPLCETGYWTRWEIDLSQQVSTCVLVLWGKTFLITQRAGWQGQCSIGIRITNQTGNDPGSNAYSTTLA